MSAYHSRGTVHFNNDESLPPSYGHFKSYTNSLNRSHREATVPYISAWNGPSLPTATSGQRFLDWNTVAHSQNMNAYRTSGPGHYQYSQGYPYSSNRVSATRTQFAAPGTTRMGSSFGYNNTGFRGTSSGFGNGASRSFYSVPGTRLNVRDPTLQLSQRWSTNTYDRNYIHP